MPRLVLYRLFSMNVSVVSLSNAVYEVLAHLLTLSQAANGVLVDISGNVFSQSALYDLIVPYGGAGILVLGISGGSIADNIFEDLIGKVFARLRITCDEDVLVAITT